MMKILSKKNIAVFFAAIFLVSFIFLFSSRQNMFDIDIYEKEFEDYDPPVENRIEITQNLLLFLQGKDADISSFSEKEQYHLKDVRALVKKGNYVLFASVIAFAGLLYCIYWLDKKTFLKNTSHVLLTTGALVYLKLALSFVLYLNFESSFNIFHRIFFTGKWQFLSSSMLITLFPQQFFSSMFLRMMLYIFIYTNIIILVGILIIIKNRRLKR
ncbi:DUF1461 domain-containing protein [Candidatus Woesearchaeota archaeon]|nr:DUF1461 domain-containing protein [Candidatus Woesearchaeota archaeon]